MVNDIVKRYLHEAVRRGDWELVSRFLALRNDVNGMDADARDGYGMTALMWAVGRGYKDIALMLLEYGSDIEARNDLLSAVSIEKLETGKGDYWSQIDQMGTLEAIKHHGWTALVWAARNGQVELVDLLLDHGANVNAITKDGFTALAHAVDNKHTETAHLLLKRDADPNLVAGGCSPALPIAAKHGMTELVQAILAHGGSINALDHFGHIALSNAVAGNHAETLLLLLQHGSDANSNYPAEVKFPPLHTAAAQDSLECAEVLLNYGADINAKDELNGATALQWAVSELSSPRVARLLIKRGADVQGALGEAEYARGTAEPDEIAEPEEIILLLKDRVYTSDEGETAL